MGALVRVQSAATRRLWRVASDFRNPPIGRAVWEVRLGRTGRVDRLSPPNPSRETGFHVFCIFRPPIRTMDIRCAPHSGLSPRDFPGFRNRRPIDFREGARRPPSLTTGRFYSTQDRLGSAPPPPRYDRVTCLPRHTALNRPEW